MKHKTLKTAFLLILLAGLSVSAQSKKGTRDTSQEAVGEKEVYTRYYGQDIPLKELESFNDVSTVRLPDEYGNMLFFSFDTEEEAMSALQKTNAAAKAGTKTCTCYKDTNYGGSSIIFTGLDYNDLDEAGWNDKISSFKCTAGASMILYQHVNWQGSNFDTDAWGISQHPNTHNIGFGDNVTAILFHF